MYCSTELESLEVVGGLTRSISQGLGSMWKSSEEKRLNVIFIYGAPLRASQQDLFSPSLLFKESPAPTVIPCGGGGFELKSALQYPVHYEIPHSTRGENCVSFAAQQV